MSFITLGIGSYLLFVVDFHETLSFAFLALVLVSYVITRPPTVCAHALYLLHHAGAEWAVGHLDTRATTSLARAH